MSARERIRIGVLVLLAIATLGTTWYWFVEGWSFVDALYMTVMTVSTVGFSEVRPLDGTGRWFTIFLVVFGVGAVLYALIALWTELLESELFRMGRRRMQQRLAKLDGHVVLCGFGRVGTTIAALMREDLPVVVIDHETERCEAAVEAGYLVVDGDATDESVLRRASLPEAAVLIVSLHSDGDAISVVLSARNLNPRLRVVARANAAHNEDKLRHAGVDHVVNPLEIGAKRLAAFARRPAVADFVDVVMHGGSLEYTLEELVIPEASALDGVALADAGIRDASGGALVLALRGPSGVFNSNPPPDEVLRAGTTVIAIGTSEQLRALAGFVSGAAHPKR